SRAGFEPPQVGARFSVSQWIRAATRPAIRRTTQGAETDTVVTPWLVHTMLSMLTVLVATGAFFFMTTRGTLLVRGLLPGKRQPADHVYPIYSNKHLIRLVDFQPVIAAILLFQYDRLVSIIVNGLRASDLRGKRALITS